MCVCGGGGASEVDVGVYVSVIRVCVCGWVGGDMCRICILTNSDCFSDTLMLSRFYTTGWFEKR